MTVTKKNLLPLMPKATAVWLVQNTDLSFQQIADSCGLHILEVENIDRTYLQGENPLLSGQLTMEEIERCRKDGKARLQFQDNLSAYLPKKKGRKYTPLAQRKERPEAISWLIKNHPSLSDAQIVRLLSTTLKTVRAIRTKTHTYSASLTPTNPVLLGFCTEQQLKSAVEIAEKNVQKTAEESTNPLT